MPHSTQHNEINICIFGFPNGELHASRSAATIHRDSPEFLAADDAYYRRGTTVRNRVRLISLYKASDTLYRASAVIISRNYLVRFCFHLVLVRRGRTYFARETESTTGMRFPLFTAKLDISVGGEYIVEGSLENADIWRAIKAGQG